MWRNHCELAMFIDINPPSRALQQWMHHFILSWCHRLTSKRRSNDATAKTKVETPKTKLRFMRRKTESKLQWSKRNAHSCFGVQGVRYLLGAYYQNTAKNMSIIEGSLEVKLPTLWTDGKHSQEEAQPWRKLEEKIRGGETLTRRKSQVRRCRCAKK